MSVIVASESRRSRLQYDAKVLPRHVACGLVFRGSCELVTVPQLDIEANRNAANWTRKELAGRLLWDLIGSPLFRLTPRALWGARCTILRAFGATVGAQVHVHPTVQITIPWNVTIGNQSAIGDRAVIYALGRIELEARVTVSQRAHLCAGTHDHRSREMRLMKPPIYVGSDAWICADAFIGPGVSIGERAIVGARAVAMKNVPAEAIVAGNPAKIIGQRTLVGG